MTNFLNKNNQFKKANLKAISIIAYLMILFLFIHIVSKI